MSVAVAVAAMAAGQADAAGLGRLTVQSALGQPLRAEVEITSLSREEAQSLAVKLASPDAFKQAGLEYSSTLSQLRFAIDRRPDGRALVRITSAQPLNEPFVDLLVELNWATGKFVREYTFLLDPPELKVARETTTQESTAPVVIPVAEPSRAQAPQPLAPVPAAPSAPSAASPAPSAAPATPRAAPQRPARAETPRPPVERAATAPAPGSVSVQAGETLAGIAARVKPANVTLEQAIIALYRANPGAFFGSVHQLRSGASLTVPDEATMSAIDAGAARTEIRAQARDFNAYKARLADAARTVPGGRSGRSASGSVTADIQDQGRGEARGDRLELSKSGDPAAGAGNSVARRGAAGEERRVATEAAVREAQSRVRDLERNVADLQKLVELKNKQLADLQKQVETARTAPAVTGSVGKAGPGTVARVDPPKAEAPKAEAPKAEPPKVEAPKVEAPKTEAPVTMAPPATTTPPAAMTPPAATTPPAVTPPAEPPKAEAPKPIVPAEPPKAETSFVDELLENPLILPGLGAILLLGAGYGWYAMRRRKKEEKFEDSLINTEGFTANSLFGSTGGQNVDTHASMFTGTRDTTADVHSTEVDPIAEAEVYIAYGRESQAEEILKEALKKQPERQAIRLKLLEIYAGRKDAKAFATVASEMYGMTGGQNEEWPKVVTLGLAVDPDNPLYTGRAAGDAETFGVNAASQPEALAEAPVDELPAIIDDMGREPFGRSADQTSDQPLDMPPRAPAASETPQAAPSIGVAAAAAGVAAAAAGAAMAFDQKPAQAEDKPVTETATASADEVPVLDFDLDIDDEIAKSSAAAATPRASDLSRALEGRFDLPSLDLSAEAGGAAAQGHAGSDQALADLEDLKIDMPSVETVEPPARADEPVAIDLSSIGLDLQPSTMVPPPTADAARWQEMATKLDLASAYEEIGDKEGARELLQEVLKGGDNDQQQKARSMLSKIS